MYESFYGLKEKPFTLLPDPDYLYLSPKHQRALTLLEYGMMNQAGFSVICGDTGAGKTTLIRRLLMGLGDDTTVGLITNTHQSFGELLNWVLVAFGLDGENKSKAQMHRMFIDFLIEQYAQNKYTVLIVDEAQNMKADMLEELRMLSNINADKDQVLQVILAGQPGLRETLRKPELMQFAQRIAVDYYLESLSKDETAVYIQHRLHVAGAERDIFTPSACDAIYRYSGGTPRLINLLCDTALVYGFAEQTEQIDANLVEDVVREQHSNSIVPTFNKPLSDEDIEAKEEQEAVSAQSVAGENQNNAVIAELGKRAKKAVSNYDTVSTGAVDHVVEESPVSTKEAPKAEVEQPVKSKESKVTPINKDVAVEKAEPEKESISGKSSEPTMDEVYEDMEKAAEQRYEETVADDSEKLQAETENEPQDELDELENLVEEPLDQTHEDELDEKLEELSATEKVAEEKKIEEELVFEEVAENRSSTKDASKKEDVYSIIQVEDNSKKNINILVLGFVGGIVLASVLTMTIAYMMFADDDKGTVQTQMPIQQQPISISTTEAEAKRQAEIEKARLEAIQKERDAALAITKALERERDAALAAAKAQEEMRAAEMRAAEIIAEQERKAAFEVQRAKERARKAEIAAARAEEREQKAKLKAIQAEIEAEKAAAAKISKQPKTVVVKEPVKVVDEPIIESQPVVEESVIKKAKPKGPAKFSANPCSSPSAKFLSTCKK